MRTFIMLSAMIVATAIAPELRLPEEATTIIIVGLCIGFIMDVFELLK